MSLEVLFYFTISGDKNGFKIDMNKLNTKIGVLSRFQYILGIECNKRAFHFKQQKWKILNWKIELNR